MNIKRLLFSGTSSGPVQASGHLSDGLLLLSIDGELSTADHPIVRDHIRSCWTCRTRRNQLEETIRGVVQYERALVEPDMPPFAGGRAIFLARLNQLSKEMGGPPLLRRWADAFTNTALAIRDSRLAWAASAVFAVGLVLHFSSGHQTPVVFADQLLLRAAESETGLHANADHPVVIQKLSIRIGNSKVVRSIYRDLSRNRQAYREDVKAGEAEVVERAFAHTTFSWNDPLSAQIFRRWRDGLAAKKEVVTRMDGGLLRLDTTATEGPIAEASLTVREQDYHPVAEDLYLRNSARMEIAELSYDVVGLSAIAPEIFAAAPVSPVLRMPSSAPRLPTIHTVVPDPAQMAATELTVRTILHRLGADMGEQITVQPTAAGTIQVSGIADDEARKRQLSNALIMVPHTEVHIVTVAQAAARAHPAAELSATTPASATLVTSGSPLLELQLERLFPDSVQRIAYVDQSLLLCQDASTHAWALDRLAERYSPEQIALLNRDAQGQLQSLLVDHVTALREDLNRLQTQLGQALPSVASITAPNALASSAAAEFSDDWRLRAHRIHASAEVLNQTVSVLLADAGEANETPDEVQLKFLNSIMQLQAGTQLLDGQIHTHI